MIDLHMHTTYSDGSKSVKEILSMCEELGLEYISITDHNTCKAYLDEAFINQKFFSGIIIKGCELSAEFHKKPIEILGYDVDIKIINKWSEETYTKEKKVEMTRKIYNNFLKVLEENGFIYKEENIMSQKRGAKSIERIIFEEILKYEENRKKLEKINREYLDNMGLFYRRELTNSESRFFIDKVSSLPSAKEIVNLIHKAGGKAFLAHPFEYMFEDYTIDIIEKLKNETNLDGIECFHHSANIRQRETLVEYAKKNNLFISGGSDFHGILKPGVEIAVGKGDLNISKNYIQDWIRK